MRIVRRSISIVSLLVMAINPFLSFRTAPLSSSAPAELVSPPPAVEPLQPTVMSVTAGCIFTDTNPNPNPRIFLPLMRKNQVATASPAEEPQASLESLIPEPGLVAPAAADTFTGSIDFLYKGDNPIQTGVDPAAIDPLRSAVLRGRACARSGQPISGVQVSILNHPEYGSTLTRADGMFDLTTNGGGMLTVVYQKSGYLPLQRQVYVPLQDFAWLPDVALSTLDSRVTSINLSGSTTMQVAKGSTAYDKSGVRTATLLIPAGTQATMVLPDGSSQPITTLSLRATEYTVGASGPAAMPAALPPSSGYTYALEYSVDQALAAGAVDVRFNQPLYHYVEDFLNFPVGMRVPVGYYDRQQGRWLPSDNGRVVKITGITAGLANLDTDGDGAADNNPALGITNAERSKLAGLYAAGQVLWRVPVKHFTPWDCNWPYGPPTGAEGPKYKPNGSNPEDCPDCFSRSIVEAQNQVLGESQAVIGTPFTLNYSSDRAPGMLAAYTLDIPLSGSSTPNQLKSIELEVTVAGQRLSKQFLAGPNQSFRFVWDGKSAYGQALNGKQPVTVRIGYTYPAMYQNPADSDKAFAAFSGIPITGNRARQEITLWGSWKGFIGGSNNANTSLGGWTLSPVHTYDPRGKVLYLGDGSRTSSDSLSSGLIRSVAGGGWVPGTGIGDGGPATLAELSWPSGIALIPGGGYDLADTGHHRIRQVNPGGVITSIAGTDTFGYNGDQIPAVQAQLNNPEAIALGPDGSLYIADRSNQRIRRIRPDGIITTIAGTGAYGFSGDGGPATAAKLNEPYGVAVGPDGGIYIADTRNERIRVVTPDGTIHTIAGTGIGGSLGDHGPAGLAQVHEPRGLAFGLDGSLYIAEYYGARVRRIGTDGIISTAAGTGADGYNGDGLPATEALLNDPIGVAVGPDDSLYIAEYQGHRIRHVGPDGVISTIAGTGVYGFSGDGGLATRAKLDEPIAVSVSPDGSIYIADGFNHRVRQEVPVFPGASVSDLAIPSEDGSEVYIFTGSGRHLKTLSALTGATLYTFAYDSAFRLVSISDGYGNITSILRDASGSPTGINGPYGQHTSLAVNAGGFLTSIVDPAGRAVQLAYSAAGLLTGLTDARGSVHQFQYDSLGRLTYDGDPTGGSLALTSSGGVQPTTVTVTTALGRKTVYASTQNPDGSRQQTVTLPGGLKTVTSISPNGVRSVTNPDGSSIVTTFGPDPRWGMMAPLAATKTISTPGGRSNTKTTSYSVALSDPNNPFSLVTFDRTITMNGLTFTSHYTQSTRTFVDTTPVGRATTRVVDAQGRLLSEQVGSYLPVLYTYDSRGRLVSAAQGSGPERRAVTLTYNGNGNLQSMTDPAGQALSFSYDAAGQRVSQGLPGGGIASYAYDANGNQTTIQPPGKLAHTFAYTPIDLVSSYTPPQAGAGSGQVLYAYNVDRQVTQVSGSGMTTTGLAYDAAGRLSSVSLGRGLVSYTYNSTTGNPTGIAAPGSINLSYALDGPLLTTRTWSGPVAGSVSFTYDNDLRMTSTSVNGGNTTSYQYDQDGLLTQAGALAFTRDPSGLVTGGILGSLADAWTYDSFGEPAGYSETFNASPVYNAQYTRDVFGRIIQEVETIGGVVDTYLYSYDQAGRLVGVSKNSVSTASYSYDANGNRLNGTVLGNASAGSYDNQERLVQYGNNSYTYSADGQLSSKTNGSQVTTYQYDSLGNLASAVLPGGNQIAYLIDGENHRIGKKVNGVLAQRFLYEDSQRIAAELDGAGNLVSRFVYAAHSNLPDLMIRNGVTYRILADRSGSPRLVVNAATGQIVQRMDYDAFGNVIADTNPGFQPFGFAGGLYDRDLKLVRLGARDYDPETGRWTARDPILFAGRELNLYTYAGNDPINGSDPAGLGPAEDKTCIEFYGPPPEGQYKFDLACGNFHACINLPDPRKDTDKACKKCRELSEQWKTNLQQDKNMNKGDKLKQECQRQDLDRICDSVCKIPCV